jgi:RHS repeat-associated protein
VRFVAGKGNFDYDLNGNMVTGDGKVIYYNTYNKPTSITKNTIQSTFDYGADLSRYRQVKSGPSIATKTSIYIDKLFEKVVEGSKTELRHYIGNVAIFTKMTEGVVTTESTKYVHRDRLGSVMTITDTSDVVIDAKSYDPFGKPRKSTFEAVTPPTLTGVALLGGWGQASYDLVTNRGFTDHEHLDDAQLIHMNGRVYDYNLGRFLSVDPFIQSPGNSQSMNPYSYIMNNPLSGTDPSGYASCGAGGAGVCKEASTNVTVKVKVKKTTKTKNVNSRITRTKTKTSVEDVSVNITQNEDGTFSASVSDTNGASEGATTAGVGRADQASTAINSLASTNGSSGGGDMDSFMNNIDPRSHLAQNGSTLEEHEESQNVDSQETEPFIFNEKDSRSIIEFFFKDKTKGIKNLRKSARVLATNIFSDAYDYHFMLSSVEDILLKQLIRGRIGKVLRRATKDMGITEVAFNASLNYFPTSSPDQTLRRMLKFSLVQGATTRRAIESVYLNKVRMLPYEQ